MEIKRFLKKIEKPELSDYVRDLVEQAVQIQRWRYIAATSPGRDVGETIEGLPANYYNFDHDVLQEIIEAVKPLLKSNQEIRKIEAETSKDIIKMLSCGKVTISDAEKLFSLLEQRLRVEERERTNKLQNEILELLGG